jgi:type VI secretion system protein ImpL
MTTTAPSRPGLQVLLALAGLLAAAALIWYVGPLVAVAGVVPLAAEAARWAAIAALAAGVVMHRTWRRIAAARRNGRLLRGLLAGVASAPAARPGDAEVAQLVQRFEQALATLRLTRLGRARRGWRGWPGSRPWVDQVPWYLLIGAPGAGKTTALVNSGLEFPLERSLGAPVVQGVGGTRNCDWWFSSEAVLIDTAGRYTTHDSDRAADRAAWFGFLDLLARHRPRRPINGVLLTLAASDLLGATAARRRAHATELRERIEELHGKLGIAFPVYVLVTKADLLAGFMEFFADFDKEERAQVWGITFPLQIQATQDGPGTRLASDFATLEKRLNDCLLERLHGESERARRASIYAFPQQWRALRQALYEVLQPLLADLRPELRPWVRGVYFTSATQEGTPMDRALGGLVRSLGLTGRTLPPSRPSGKSFFVTNLLRDTVFAESGLAGTNVRWRRRRALWASGLAGAGACAVAAAGALSWQAYASTGDRIAALGERLPAIEHAVENARHAAPTDLPALLPVLDALAAAAPAAQPPQGALQRAANVFGLDRSEMLVAAAHDGYERTLREALLPRLAARLEQRLRGGEREHVELIYDTLKAYLMLFGGRRFDRDALRAYLLADWQQTLPASTRGAQQAALRQHLERLLAGGEVGAPSAADPQLIARSRTLVASVPLAQRAYQRLRQLEAVAGAAPFSVESAGGAAARSLFARGNSSPLDPGVPALYTRAAFEVVPRLTREVLRQFENERAWVIGAEVPAADEAQQQATAAAVQQLYLADYAKHWEAFLSDLRLAPVPTLAASADQAAAIARADSPWIALLSGAARELSIAPLDAAADAATSVRLDALRRYVTGPPGLQPLQTLLGTVAAQLRAADDAARRQVLPPPSEAMRELAAAAQQAPEPVRGMLAQLASSGAAQEFGALREPLSRQLAGEIAPLCQRLVAGRYPFVRQGSTELSREDFARAFAAGGLLDGFFQRHLQPHVDTSTRPWSFVAGGGGGDALAAFQHARAIRDAFFKDGGRQFGLKLELRLLELEAGIAEFVLDVDGQVLRFRSGAGAPQTLQWPGPADSGRVQLQLVPASGPAGAGHAFQGAWALLRLLDRVRSEPGPTPDRWRLVFDVEGRKARFEVRASGALNAISRQELEQFECPKKL